MRNRKTSIKNAIAIALTIYAVACAASMAEYKLHFTGGSRLWLEGDSTLHAFESEATVLELESKIDMPLDGSKSNAPILADEKKKPRIAALFLKIPIEDMKSGVLGLASRLHKTLKYEEHPNITFSMSDYDVQKSAEQEDLYNVTVRGTVQLAGEEKKVTLNMTAKHSNEYVKVVGEKTLLMSDFGIEPPSLMFGAIKTDNEIIAHWDLKVKLGKSKEGRVIVEEAELSKK